MPQPQANKMAIAHIFIMRMCILKVTPTICLSICLFIYVSSLVAAYCINHALSPPQQLPLVNVALQQLRTRGGVRNRV